MREKSNSIITFFPLSVGLVLSFLILWRNRTMGETGWIPILVAVTGVLGALIVAILQLKRDGKTIDSISGHTADMKPRVENIQTEAIDIRKKVSEKILPQLNDISKQDAELKGLVEGDISSSLKVLTNEVEYQRRLKQELSPQLESRDRMVARIDLIFQENARLELELREKEKELAMQKNRILDLQQDIAREKEKNQELRAALDKQQKFIQKQELPKQKKREKDWDMEL